MYYKRCYRMIQIIQSFYYVIHIIEYFHLQDGLENNTWLVSSSWNCGFILFFRLIWCYLLVHIVLLAHTSRRKYHFFKSRKLILRFKSRQLSRRNKILGGIELGIQPQFIRMDSIFFSHNSHYWKNDDIFGEETFFYLEFFWWEKKIEQIKGELFEPVTSSDSRIIACLCCCFLPFIDAEWSIQKYWYAQCLYKKKHPSEASSYS